MPQRLTLVSLALLILVGMMSWLPAAPTREQRAAELKLRTMVKKAGNFYLQKKYEESGQLIADVQKQFEQLMEGADEDLVELLAGVYSSLQKAHALLELEGVELPPLKAAVVKPAPADKPTMPDGKVSFVKHVAPILISKCGRCHVSAVRGMFSMATFELLMKGTPDGTVIFPKDASGSRLIEVIEEGDMPRGGLKITPPEFATLKKWITEGAIFDAEDRQANLSSLAPGATQAELPKLEVMEATGEETISFSNDIAPLLVASCINCHGLGQRPSGRLNLNTFAGLLRGGESGPPLVPGKPADSLLIKKLKGTGGGQQMPARADPLPTDVIAKIETWIEEGARFDAPNPAQPMTEVAALARAMRANHDELSAERRKLASNNWKLSLPDLEMQTHQTTNFLLVGSFSETRLQGFGTAAEQVAEQVAAVFKLSPETPLVKGRMTLFLFGQRYDYSEFGKMVEKRDLPRGWRGHWRFSIVDAYAALLPPRADEYQLEALVGQQLTSVYVAGLGNKIPDWFSEGVGRVVAGRINPEDPRVKAWDNSISDVKATMKASDDFLTGKLSPEDRYVVSYSYTRFLMAESKRFNSLIAQLKDGVEFSEAFSDAFDGSPSQVAELWARKSR